MENYVSINKIDLVVYGEDDVGHQFVRYANGRGVCGLVAAVGGSLTYTFSDGSKCELCAGETALFSDKVAYVTKNTGTEPFAHYTVNFFLSADSEFEPEIMIKPVNFGTFADKCTNLYSLWNSGRPTAGMRCTAILYELIADMFESNLVDEVGVHRYNMVLPAIEYISQNYAEDITVDFLAKLCAMSNTNFRRVFTAVCGSSPIQYLLDLRLRHATEFLQQSSCTVTEVAQLCGFKDVEHFCRTYKKKNGVTAGRMRRNSTK